MNFKSQIMKIDFSPGELTFLDADITSELSIGEQLDSLKEDLVQVTFPENVTLDVGWYPSFDEKGCFKIYLVYDFDWTEPSFYAETKSIEHVVEILKAVKNLVM